MKACYIDESGCPNILQQAGNPDITPIFAVTAVFFDLDDLPEITGEFTFLKQRHFWPNESWHDCMHTVYKGSEIRRAARSDYKPDQQRNSRFLGQVIKLLHKKEAKVVSLAGNTPHVSNRFYHLKKRFIRDLKDLEYRFETPKGYNGGIAISNHLDDRGSSHFFD